MTTKSDLPPLDGALDDEHNESLVAYYRSVNMYLTFQVKELERQLRRSRVLLWIALVLIALMGSVIGGLVYYGDATRLVDAIGQVLPARVAG